MQNWEQYQQAYAIASDDVKKVLNSTAIPSAVESLIVKGKLQASQKKRVIVLFSDYILGMYDSHQTSSMLQELGGPNNTLSLLEDLVLQLQSAAEDTVTIYDTPISEEFAASETSTPQNELTSNTPRESIPQPAKVEESVAPADLAAEIAEAEAALHTVQPMRTMTHDMELTRGAQGRHVAINVAAPAPAPAPAVATTHTPVIHQVPTSTPPAASVAAAAEDRIPTPSELLKPATDPNNLVADGAGNQVQNHNATWGSTQ